MPLGSSSAAPVMSPGPSRDEEVELRRQPPASARPMSFAAPLNPCATTYHSLESLRLAGGLACFTVAKCRLSWRRARCRRRRRAPWRHRRRPAAAPRRRTQPRLDQRHRAQMIGLRVADGVRGHVGEDEVGRPAERLLSCSGAASSMKSMCRIVDAVDRVGRQQVDADDLCLAAIAGAPPGSSRPARCRGRRRP